jgi:hypothetical protein
LRTRRQGQSNIPHSLHVIDANVCLAPPKTRILGGSRLLVAHAGTVFLASAMVEPTRALFGPFHAYFLPNTRAFFAPNFVRKATMHPLSPRPPSVTRARKGKERASSIDGDWMHSAHWIHDSRCVSFDPLSLGRLFTPCTAFRSPAIDRRCIVRVPRPLPASLSPAPHRPPQLHPIKHARLSVQLCTLSRPLALLDRCLQPERIS